MHTISRCAVIYPLTHTSIHPVEYDLNSAFGTKAIVEPTYEAWQEKMEEEYHNSTRYTSVLFSRCVPATDPRDDNQDYIHVF